MAFERESPTLGDYWSIIKRRWRVVAVTMLVVLLLAGLYLYKSGKSYSSNASVVIKPINVDPTQPPPRTEDVGAATEANVVASTVVARDAAKRLDRSTADARKLLSNVSVTNPLNTLILDISYSGSTPAKAQAGAQAFADAYLAHRRQSANEFKQNALSDIASQRNALNKELAGVLTTISSTLPNTDPYNNAQARKDVLVSQIGDLEKTSATIQAFGTDPGQLIEPATLPSAPSGPGIPITVIGAGLFGLILGAGLAIVRDRTDRHIRSRSALIDVIDTEPLADIPITGPKEALPAVDRPTGQVAGAYRRLRVRVWPRRGSGPQRVLVTSPVASAAADAVAANLAVTIERSGWSALLTWPDRDDLRPYFDIDPVGTDPNGPYLPVEKLLVPVPGLDGLMVLPNLSQDHGTGTESSEVGNRLAELATLFDVEVLVGAPVLTSAESLELCPLVDGSILVFDAHVCDRKQLERSIEVLSGVGTPVLGVVAFGVPANW